MIQRVKVLFSATKREPRVYACYIAMIGAFLGYFLIPDGLPASNAKIVSLSLEFVAVAIAVLQFLREIAIAEELEVLKSALRNSTSSSVKKKKLYGDLRHRKIYLRSYRFRLALAIGILLTVSLVFDVLDALSPIS